MSILDPIGGRSFARSYECLAPLGRLTIYGASSLAPSAKRRLWPAVKGLLSMPRFSPVRLMNDNRSVMGLHVGHLWSEKKRLRRCLDEIVRQVRDGGLTPQIDGTFSFAEAAAAHHYLQDHKNFGKVLLVPGDG